MSKLLWRSLVIFIIKVFRTIVFIFIVIFTTFWVTIQEYLYPVMANGIRKGDPVDFFSVKVPELDKHLKEARGHIDRNVAEITRKMKTVRKPLMMKDGFGIKYYASVDLS